MTVPSFLLTVSTIERAYNFSFAKADSDLTQAEWKRGWGIVIGRDLQEKAYPIVRGKLVPVGLRLLGC
jgi:hypothetical protein